MWQSTIMFTFDDNLARSFYCWIHYEHWVHHYTHAYTLLKNYICHSCNKTKTVCLSDFLSELPNSETCSALSAIHAACNNLKVSPTTQTSFSPTAVYLMCDFDTKEENLNNNNYNNNNYNYSSNSLSISLSKSPIVTFCRFHNTTPSLVDLNYRCRSKFNSAFIVSMEVTWCANVFYANEEGTAQNPPVCMSLLIRNNIIKKHTKLSCGVLFR